MVETPTVDALTVVPESRVERIARPIAGGNFELYSWFFMRISGLLLVVLAIGHLVLVHVINPVENVDFNFVVERWANPFWRIYDFLLLWLALLHGLNGLKYAIDDYVHTRGWRVFSLAALWTIGFIALVIGSLVIFTFQSRP